ncbi:nitrous oxide reductase accessory protein NosL [Thermopetrobacter sp. TC1]|uniref:nitrous oxide reductase accessory protein NosL n=1 Tax=Thermopetrobacter sp. TC1 TaxID=1495045 RepID=UPI0009DD651E|nr:nitrous oxide reductase accessory protein NosL [Thermopetrobacter sp. TC1]
MKDKAPLSSFRISRRALLRGLAHLGLVLALSVPLATSHAAEPSKEDLKNAAPRVQLPPVHEHDRCPVCGMFPARYHEWLATIEFKDGTAVHFDGAKDMFKFWLNMKKYDTKGHTQKDVKAIGVTGYYATEMIDARKAWYVIGSDVLGPMGHELVPHPDLYDAKEFMKDHHGKAIVRFDDVDMQLLKGLDEGRFIVHGKELK